MKKEKPLENSLTTSGKDVPGMEPELPVWHDTSPTILILRCALCRRVRDDGGEFSRAEWREIMEFMNRYHLNPGDIVLSDTYCDECTMFYRQLVTYGRAGQSFVGGTQQGPITA